jgi:hypothetical protein
MNAEFFCKHLHRRVSGANHFLCKELLKYQKCGVWGRQNPYKLLSDAFHCRAIRSFVDEEQIFCKLKPSLPLPSTVL